jgi:hypothetical protein
MRRNHLFLFILVLALILPGCNMPVPTCPTESLQAVTLTNPVNWSTVASLNPTLQWTYPDPSCTPAGYAVTLRTGPFFLDNLGGGTGDSSTSWSPGAPLEPGKEYSWGVAPINGVELGPFEGSNYFFTGPTCATAALVAPTLLEPADEGTFNETVESLIWDYPLDCSPEGYRVDLSTDPTFADTSLSGGTGNPSTRWAPGSPLTDCATYYWRVAGINGSTLGPFSATRSFLRNVSGECLMPASALISGIVWNDMCDVPDGPLPSPMPTGCVDDGAGSAQADGVRQEGEPGIPGVQVDLHWGGCATPPVASVLTDAEGHYEFTGLLAFGSYCVAIRPLNPPNDSVLIPGEWTFPFGLSGVDAFANATVAEGMLLTDKDFGWDYQFGASSTSTPVPSVTPVAASGPKFVFDKNAFCREGPSTVFSDVTAMTAGETVDILGRNDELGSLWYFVEWKKFTVKCWVAASTGHPLGDLTAIPELASPPTPTPTSVPIPTKTPLKP